MERGNKAVEVDSSPCSTMAMGRGNGHDTDDGVALKRWSTVNQSSSGVSQRSRRSYTSLHAMGRELGDMSCSTASWKAREPQIVCQCSLRSSGAGWKGRASNDATTSGGESSRPW